MVRGYLACIKKVGSKLMRSRGKASSFSIDLSKLGLSLLASFIKYVRQMLKPCFMFAMVFLELTMQEAH